MKILRKILGIPKKYKEQVMYGVRGGKQLAKSKLNKDGEIILDIKGEKYPLAGHPRHHFMHGPLSPLKNKMKNLVIESIPKLLEKCISSQLPEEQWCVSVKAIGKVFDKWIEAEDEPSMKYLAGQIKDAICMFLQEDDAYRFRVQWLFEEMLKYKKDIKLTKADKYYFRAKSFKVDK